MDVQDLMEEYKKSEKLPSDYNRIGLVSVYELVLSFIKDNPNAHFILDEVPLCKGIKLKNFEMLNMLKIIYYILLVLLELRILLFLNRS